MDRQDDQNGTVVGPDDAEGQSLGNAVGGKIGAKKKCPFAVRHGQSDIYDLTFSMGYPVRSAGYIFTITKV